MSESGISQSALEVRDLRVGFARRGGVLGRVIGRVNAVEGVSFSIERGESLGLVGESGSGKSTVARAVLGLVAFEGTVRISGVDLGSARGSELALIRKHVQMIFQDPGGSLDPRMRIGAIVSEPLEVHRAVPRSHIPARVASLLERCGMTSGSADRFPHELSGGQKQRVAIARALALAPELLVCDEPTSALDVSVQAQILNLLKDLQRDMGLAMLFISHDLAVVDHLCARVAVMRHGKIIEHASREAILSSPEHAYTRELLTASGGDAPRPHAPLREGVRE